MEIKGRITNILPMKSGISQAGKEWANQVIAIETEGQYPKCVALQLSGKPLDYNKDKLRLGQMITAKFDVSSREYNGNYYTTLNAFNVEIHAPQSEPVMESSGHHADEPDGLPF